LNITSLGLFQNLFPFVSKKENFRDFSEVLVDSSESTILNITSLGLFQNLLPFISKKENFRDF
jgi:hypothetical protein